MDDMSYFASTSDIDHGYISFNSIEDNWPCYIMKRGIITATRKYHGVLPPVSIELKLPVLEI